MDVSFEFVKEVCGPCPVAQDCLRALIRSVEEENVAQSEHKTAEAEHLRNQQEYHYEQHEVASPFIDRHGHPIISESSEQVSTEQAESGSSQTDETIPAEDILNLVICGPERIRVLREESVRAGQRAAETRNNYQTTTLNCTGPKDFMRFGRVTLVQCQSPLVMPYRRIRRAKQ
jgi:hypothetical protein